MRFFTNYKAWFLLIIALVVIDQLSKSWIVSSLAYRQVWVLTPFFEITHVYNFGAAFSFLADQSGWQRWFFVSISSVASIALLVWILKTPIHKKLTLAALSLILAGAVGNLIDRILFGYVIDFISVHYQHYYFPAFNVADSAITIGAGLLLLDMWKEKPDDAH